MLSKQWEFKVRFNEADPLGIVWHGYYLHYFEDGREDFGAHHKLTYLDIFKQGYIVPIVSVHCDYKKPLQYGDKAVVETTFVPTPAAKIIFRYKIFMPGTGEVVATGESIQVFLDKETKSLQLCCPAFFEEWKQKLNLL